jgi:hypothetical protein
MEELNNSFYILIHSILNLKLILLFLILNLSLRIKELKNFNHKFIELAIKITFLIYYFLHMVHIAILNLNTFILNF